MNPVFWKNKRVFITGHTGFKGSWLSLWLQSVGASLKGYSLEAPTSPSLFEEAKVGDGMVSEIGDIRNYDQMLASIKAFQPDIVLHLAAQPLVRQSYSDPLETYSTNVMGTANLLEALRHCDSVGAVVVVTSDKCYENREWHWGYRESEAMGGYDPYSNSKGCSELVTSSFRQSFFPADKYDKHGVGIASARAGNVIGGGDWAADRLIPDMLKAFSAQQVVEIRSPHAVRPWQHVLEPLSGYLLLAEKLYTYGATYAEGWNFGPFDQDARPVEWIVTKLTSLWGEGAAWQLNVDEHLHEATYLKLDCSKASARLNWQPRWSLANTLQKIVDWHKNWLEGKDIQQVTLAEISEYTNTQSENDE
ncbi:MAG: CDP-glucose 4,6-dehydratase [Bacteroidota bacterium]